jgi:hypothetical protein
MAGAFRHSANPLRWSILALFTEQDSACADQQSAGAAVSVTLSLASDWCGYVIARSALPLRLKSPVTYWSLMVRVCAAVAFTSRCSSCLSKLGILTRSAIMLASS